MQLAPSLIRVVVNSNRSWRAPLASGPTAPSVDRAQVFKCLLDEADHPIAKMCLAVSHNMPI